MSFQAEKRSVNVRALFALLAGALVVSACGSSGSLQSAQSNKNVQQTETKVEQQVRKCLPTSHGAPDPLLLRHHAALVTFEGCTGVAKNARSFDKCAVKVILGGLPTASRLTKGLTGCVEQNA